MAKDTEAGLPEKKIEKNRDGKLTTMEKLTNFLEKDTRAIEIITYGVTSVGLMVAMYRIRPFAKFTKPSDVPSRFVKLKIPQAAVAKRIEPSHGALIMVDHKPLVPLPRFGAPQHLPLKIAGVHVTNLGISWLQTIVSGKKIEFVPVARRRDYLECTINLRDTKDKTLSVGEELVKLGFGTLENLEPESTKDQLILAYKSGLNTAQKVAKIERNGYWHFATKPTYFWKVRYYVHTKLSQVLAPDFVNRLRW